MKSGCRAAASQGGCNITTQSRITAVVLMLLAFIVGASSASAHCWTCLYDIGLGQWYCQSVAGLAGGTCVPVLDDVCQLGSVATCEYDGCTCQRYPALKLGKKPLGPPPSSVGVMLLRGATTEQQQALLSGVTESPTQIDVGDNVVSPDLAIREIARLNQAVHADALQLAGYAAVTKRGFATSRILGAGERGVLVDARLSHIGQRVRVSRLGSATRIESTNEVELAPNRAMFCKVNVGDEQYVCVIWARTVPRSSNGMSQEHQQFTDAAVAFKSQGLVEFQGDSPDIRLFDLEQLSPSPWANVATYYH